MSTHPIDTLLQLWKQNKITTEQAMGYTLQHIAALTEQQTELQKQLRLLQPSPHTEAKRKPQA